MTAPGPAPSLGLALGGGGARGFAHLIVLQALDEMGIAPAAIAGTSIGALFGAAFASGISSDEIRERAGRIVGGRGRALRHLIASRPPGPQGMLGLIGSRGSLLNAPSIAEALLPELADSRIEDLAIPLTIAATDFHARRAVALSKGPLIPALAASMALPVLFTPVEIAGRWHVDGGLTNPLPYDLLPAACDIVVAIDVTGGPTETMAREPAALDIMVGAIQIMLATMVASKVDSSPPDILIAPPVDDFRLLDLFRFADILAAAGPVRDELKVALSGAIKSFGRQRTGA